MLNPQAAFGPTPRSAIFSRAEAREAGFPVNRPAVSSAKYSRSRWIAGSKNLLKGSKNRIRDRTREKTLNSASWCLRCISSCATADSSSSLSRSLVKPTETRTVGSLPPMAIARGAFVSTIPTSTSATLSNFAMARTKSLNHDSAAEGVRGANFRSTEPFPYLHTKPEIAAEAARPPITAPKTASGTPSFAYATMRAWETHKTRLPATNVQKKIDKAYNPVNKLTRSFAFLAFVTKTYSNVPMQAPQTARTVKERGESQYVWSASPIS